MSHSQSLQCGFKNVNHGASQMQEISWQSLEHIPLVNWKTFWKNFFGLGKFLVEKN